MDYRQVEVLVFYADKRLAMNQRKAIEAACYPKYKEEGQRQIDEDLLRRINQTFDEAQAPARTTPMTQEEELASYTDEQWAQWANGRNALAQGISHG